MIAHAGSGKNVAFVILAAAAVGVAGIVAWRLAGPGASGSATIGVPPPATAAVAAAADSGATPPLPRIVFQADSDRLPPGSLDLLTGFADAARGAHGATVEISAWYPAGGDAAKAADLARRRAYAVRHALEANGVAPAQIRAAVAQVPAGNPADAAGWVEVVLH